MRELFKDLSSNKDSAERVKPYSGNTHTHTQTVSKMINKLLVTQPVIVKHE